MIMTEEYKERGMSIKGEVFASQDGLGVVFFNGDKWVGIEFKDMDAKTQLIYRYEIMGKEISKLSDALTLKMREHQMIYKAILEMDGNQVEKSFD